MALRIRHIQPDATLSTQLSLEALARVLSPTIVSDVLQECSANERRSRKLPAASVVLFCVAMNLYSTDCLTHVFFRLVSGLRWILADPDDWRVSKGALSQARYRLGARPLAALFRRVCADKPLAEPGATPGAFLFGLRLMALDSTRFSTCPRHPGERPGLRPARLLAGHECLAAGAGACLERVRHPRHMRRGCLAPRFRRTRRRTSAAA